MARTLTPDQRAARLASRRHAAISRQQALAAGLTEDQVRWRVRTGRWLLAAPGVFVIAGSDPVPEQDVAVACLAGPEGTVASHLSAAALLGLVPHPEVLHVTIPRSCSGRAGEAIVHRPRKALESWEVCRVGKLRCTSPARTLVDCAGLVPYDAFCTMLDAALCRKLATPPIVRAAADAAARARDARDWLRCTGRSRCGVPGPVARARPR